MGFDKVKYAENIITSDYGVVAKVEAKKKSLIKFGRNDSLNNSSFELIWTQGGLEVLATGNDIDTVSSSNASDTMTMILEGHTIDSKGDLSFVVQSVTLNGNNKVVLDTPLYRSSRMYNPTSTPLQGNVYVYEDDTIVAGVPQTPAKIHLKVNSADNQSLKCATSLSSTDFWIITELVVSVDRQAASAVDFKLQVSKAGTVFRTYYPVSAHNQSGSNVITFEQPIIIPPNSDIRVIAQSSANSTGANAAIHGYLASIQ